MNNIIHKRKDKLGEIILVYLVIGFSVIPFFSSNPDFLMLITIGLAIFIFVKFGKSRLKMGKETQWIFALLIFMYVGQIITLGLAPVDFRSVFGTFIRFLFSFFL